MAFYCSVVAGLETFMVSSRNSNVVIIYFNILRQNALYQSMIIKMHY